MSRTTLGLSLLLLGAATFGVVQLLKTPSGSKPAQRKEAEAARGPQTTLADVRAWVYQLQGLERPGATDRLVRADADLFVLETTDTVRGSEDFPIRGLVTRLHARGGRRPLCLAYLNVGQAEDYRTYWRDAWRPAAATGARRTGFVLCPDPDGWEGNFPVAYWDPAWPPVLFGSPDALLDRILTQGFDGVYLDWVLGFADPFVAATAKREGVDPARAMGNLIRALRTYARAARPGFLIVVQNPGDLIDRVPGITVLIDGIAQEGLLFQGEATDDWRAPAAGGHRRPADDEWNTAALARLLRRYGERTMPVFTVDYALDADDRREALEASRAFGFIPCVTRTPLDRIPDHALRTGADER